jgi:hypothetical protein
MERIEHPRFPCGRADREWDDSRLDWRAEGGAANADETRMREKSRIDRL